MRKLRPGGVLCFHLSNSWLDLVPVVDAIATDLGLAGAAKFDLANRSADRVIAKNSSTWAVVAQDPSVFDAIVRAGGWQGLPRRKGAPWTDDASNLWSAIRLR